jgi:hypothetical protein
MDQDEIQHRKRVKEREAAERAHSRKLRNQFDLFWTAIFIAGAYYMLMDHVIIFSAVVSVYLASVLYERRELMTDNRAL